MVFIKHAAYLLMQNQQTTATGEEENSATKQQPKDTENKSSSTDTVPAIEAAANSATTNDANDKDVNSNLSLDTTECPALNNVGEDQMKELAAKMTNMPTEAAKALATPSKASE